MTNLEKYKTVKEKNAAFERFCELHRDCEKCPLLDSRDLSYGCIINWLEMEAEEKLLPCPFCGCVNVSKIKTDFRDADGPTYICVRCKDCGAEVYDTGEDKAIEKWNRRAK